MEAAPDAQQKRKKNRKNKGRNKFKPKQSEQLQRGGADGAGDSGKQRTQPPPRVAGDGAYKPGLSKKQRQKEKRRQAVEAAAAADDGPSTSGRGAAAAASPGAPLFGGKKQGKAASGGGKGGGSLLERMRQRLQGSRFRWLNEKLYTCEGGEALSLMSREPELYEQYHEGFREQTKGWPTQPVDVAIRWLSEKPPGWAVADLGCGDAKLAVSVPQQGVRSFDLVATAPGVEACNMADLPLGHASLDAAVFCLSLMGTDYGSFVAEAARVLRPGGWLWVAEVQSRFVDEGGRSVLEPFVAAVQALGLELKHKDLKNPFFLTLQFQKKKKAGAAAGQRQEAQPRWPLLRACQYKKR